MPVGRGSNTLDAEGKKGKGRRRADADADGRGRPISYSLSSFTTDALHSKRIHPTCDKIPSGVSLAFLQRRNYHSRRRLISRMIYCLLLRWTPFEAAERFRFQIGEVSGKERLNRVV